MKIQSIRSTMASWLRRFLIYSFVLSKLLCLQNSHILLRTSDDRLLIRPSKCPQHLTPNPNSLLLYIPPLVVVLIRHRPSLEPCSLAVQDILQIRSISQEESRLQRR